MTITPAQKILLQSAQDTIDRLRARIQTLETERADHERSLIRARAEIKSLKKELEQRNV